MGLRGGQALGAGQLMDRGGSGGDAGGSELQRAVDRATRDTPYMVVSTEKGFDVGLRLADARWRQFFGSAVLRQTFRWKVTEKKSRYSITDEAASVRWAAGVPRFDFSASKQSGRIFSFSRSMIWAPSNVAPFTERPNAPASRISIMRLADSMSVLLGMQPLRMQRPPSSFAPSITAVRRPSLAAVRAAA